MSEYELIRQIFAGMVVEVFSLLVAWRVGGDTRKRLGIVAAGTLAAGFIVYVRPRLMMSHEPGLVTTSTPHPTSVAYPTYTPSPTLPLPPTPAATVVPSTPTPVVLTPTRVPPSPTSPRIFVSDDKVPGSGDTTLGVRVSAGEVHAVTSGPICVAGSGVCLPGGAYDQRRGSVVVLLPREEQYLLTGLVPLNNWHGAYYAQPGQAQQLAESLAEEMMVRSPSNVNCTGGCDVIDILIVGGDGIVASYGIQR